jgi:hypothetical protein
METSKQKRNSVYRAMLEILQKQTVEDFYCLCDTLMELDPDEIEVDYSILIESYPELMSRKPSKENLIHIGRAEFWFEPYTIKGYNDRIRVLKECIYEIDER